ncbi:serine/threonine-protein kinase [Streptomyces hoynatensis]|uniref:Serine/threonine protein kinase n=1 Tax=Streptomyces hoynatensis TaxID=1141874 RepID=A0A3A9YU31_9ACTN|nr:serine/threonine-protein kinase [Streptomyces hoynatensis]RKN39548.1 serine/threonine protein kinase [Streptomyces hoynatensis]
MDRLTPQDPHRIGRYRLLGRLGEGGMGQVYLARSERGRMVAVKTIRSALAQEPDFRERFALEITAAQRVGGQWTAPVLDADTEAATPWVATGYIAGPSLHQVVSQQFGPLPERSVSLLANGLGHALRDIHGAGLVHRDLKPSNVLLTIDGPRVIDFGIARALDVTTGGLTRTGATVGSPGFMSPEQVRGRRLTPASDIFCLGSLLAYAATGRTPFGSLQSGVHILLFRIVEESPDLSEIPEQLRHLISGCLAKEPDQRFSLDDILSLTAPDGSREPWLPGPLVAQLGRHAVELLDSEDPQSRTDGRALGAPTRLATPQVPQGHTGAPPTASAQPATSPQPAQPAHPSPPQPWPAAAPTPHPVPVPSPYSQPNLSYTPHSMPSVGSMPNTGGFGAPYATGPQPARRRRPPLGVVAAIGVLALVAVLGVVVANQLAGGDDSTIDEAYLGAWQGDYEDGSGVLHKLRFEIVQGGEGDVVGTAMTLAPRELCRFDMVMTSFSGDDGLEFTERSDWSVPEDAVTSGGCGDDDRPQRLKLGEDGLDWSYREETSTLHEAPSDGNAVVPDTLIGDWGGAWETDDHTQGRSDITISQGSFGDSVLRYTETTDETTCTWENRLVQVNGREIVLGPDTLVESGEGDECDVYAAFRLWTEEDDDSKIKIVWLNDLDRDPVEFARNG